MASRFGDIDLVLMVMFHVKNMSSMNCELNYNNGLQVFFQGVDKDLVCFLATRAFKIDALNCYLLWMWCYDILGVLFTWGYVGLHCCVSFKMDQRFFCNWISMSNHFILIWWLFHIPIGFGVTTTKLGY
jgi:hypothetical protein